MKKTLLYLQGLVLTTTPILTTISCNKTSKSTKNKLNPVSVLAKQEQEIMNNTSLFTKLLLLSRHENLNFNSTDLLNAVFAPKTTWTAFARNYTINGKTYNLTDYTEKLTSEYSNLAKLSATRNDPFLASVLTGMYEDKLYQNYIGQKFNKAVDIFDFFGENYTDEHSITPVVQLASNPNRCQLAWANFTGPLSKYFTDKHIFNYQDLDYEGEDARPLYGRFLDTLFKDKSLTSKVVKKNDGTTEKVKLEGIKLHSDKNNEIEEFGKYQTKLYQNQLKANFSAQILEFIPFIQSFNETSTGSIYGLKLLNSLFPFTDTKGNMDVPNVLFFLLETTIQWMRQFSSKYTKDDKAKEIKNTATKLTGPIDAVPGIIGGLFGKSGVNFLQGATQSKKGGFKVQTLMTKKGKKTELFETIKTFKNLVSQWVVTWDQSMKDNFLIFFKEKVEKFKETAKNVSEGIADLIDEGIGTLNSSDDVIAFFTVLGNMMGIFADHQDIFIDIDNNAEYDNKDFSTLTKPQQHNIAKLFGFKNNKFEEGSVLDGLYKVINNKAFNKIFLNHDSSLYKFNSKNVQQIHDSLLQYALDDQYWKIDEKSFKMKGAISGIESLNSSFSYTLEYKGNGDKTVTKFLDHPVELPNDFNPVEPWHTSPTKISDGWTVQDYIDYTGLGNDAFYDKVNFKYNVEWSNVSDKPEFPYWVITKVDLFRNENGQWKQFYPVM